MRLPRMTTRRWMDAVAIVAIVLGVAVLKKRRDERLQKQVYYSGLERKYAARAEASASGELSNTALGNNRCRE
jgi:hypothetical protein